MRIISSLSMHLACMICLTFFALGNPTLAQTDDSPAMAATRPAIPDITPPAGHKKVYILSDLMPGGQLIVDPLRHGIQYYTAHQLSWTRTLSPAQSDATTRANAAGKPTGLFISTDHGATWRHLSYQFDFQFLFVHPLDGKLYTIIEYQVLRTNDDGYETRHFAQKVLMSEDGWRWKDIYRTADACNEYVNIFQDPDHPSRVCVHAICLRDVIFQPVDDTYEKWRGYHLSQWLEKHPQYIEQWWKKPTTQPSTQ